MQISACTRLAYYLFYIAVFGSIPLSSTSQVLNRSGDDQTIFVSHTVFMPKFTYVSGKQNWKVKAADMNQDGYEDIITASRLDGMINIHLNDGAGEFGQKAAYPSHKNNRSLCIFHANEDNFPDVATVSIDGKLSILTNDGTGKLSIQEKHEAGVMAHDIHAADLDGDGKEELIVALVSSRRLSIFSYIDQSGFQKSQILESGWEPRSVISADINGDQHTDLIAGCDDGRIYLYLNDGGGKFADKIAIASGSSNWALGAQDFNGDGHIDIATGSYLDKMLSIHLNDGKAGFIRSQQILSGDHNFDLVCGDFDQDGDLDIVTCSTVDEAISIHLNQGDGVFNSRIGVPSGNWNAGIAQADFDGDGDLDIVTASINDHMINVHRNISIEKEKVEPQESPLSRLAYFCIKGVVRNAKTQEIIPDAYIKAQNVKGKKLSKVRSRQDGSYEICLQPTEYKLATQAPGFFHNLSEINFVQQDSSQIIEQDIYLTPLEKEAKIVLQNIYFDVDKTTLRDESVLELEELLEILEGNPSLIVEISGHTDSDGTDFYNEALSQGRAQAVVDFLTNAGINKHRMLARGYGEKQPLAENNSKANKQLNRRTEFKVVDY